MYELKTIGKVLTSKFVGTGPSSYEKRIYRAALSQRLRNTGLDYCFPDFLARGPPFWLRKITTDPHILADVNEEYPDDRYRELQIYISELISDSHQYIAGGGRNNALHYLTLIKLSVARFVATGDCVIRYSNGHTK